MILLRDLLEFGLAVTGAALFLSLTLAMEVGFRLGRLTVIRRSTKSRVGARRNRPVASPSRGPHINGSGLTPACRGRSSD
jgi:hypothetical protein